jgi:hypothetical protein
MLRAGGVGRESFARIREKKKGSGYSRPFNVPELLANLSASIPRRCSTVTKRFASGVLFVESNVRC